MTNYYNLKFINESPQGGDFLLFQKRQVDAPGTQTLAWMVRPAAAGASGEFTWTTTYSFLWAQSGPLAPGVVVQPAALAPTDLATNNQITLTRAGGGYQFVNQCQGTQAGTAWLQQDNTVEPTSVAVGLAVDGRAIVAAQAHPDSMRPFTPHPSYWLAFGQGWQAGEVLDGEVPTTATEIRFPPAVYTMVVVLHPDLSWTIRAGSA